MKFGNQTNLNVLSLMVMFTFSVLDQKYSFWANLVQKLKYTEFASDVYLLYFGPVIAFLGKLSPKNQDCLFKMKVST